MRVVDVKFREYKTGKMLGFANVMFSFTKNGDGAVWVNGFTVFDRENGQIDVSFPSTKEKDKNGEIKWRKVFWFVEGNEEAGRWKEHVREEVQSHYNKYLHESTANKNVRTQEKTNSTNFDDDIPF